MPYTPSDEIARMKRKPTGRSANTMSMRPQRDAQGAAKGITAHVSSAGMKDSIGAMMNSGLFTAPGIDSSFMMFLRPSAAGCSSPP